MSDRVTLQNAIRSASNRTCAVRVGHGTSSAQPQNQTRQQKDMIIVSEPIIELPVDDILVRFDHGDKWIQGLWENGRGECLHNGIRACMPRKGDAFLIEQVAEVYGWGTDWNDQPGRTFDDIKQTLVEHREILPHEMLATFGPQWEQIAAFVRHVAELSSDEVHRIAAAWDASRDAALDASRAAARATARNAAGYAARNAAGCAAGYAAWDAAVALSIRDLIGQHEFTQEHYRTLTQPCSSVIGKVHPDD